MTDFKKLVIKFLTFCGGKNFVASRFAGKLKEEVSVAMAKVRTGELTEKQKANVAYVRAYMKTPEYKAEGDALVAAIIKGLNN